MGDCVDTSLQGLQNNIRKGKEIIITAASNISTDKKKTTATNTKKGK